MLGQTSLDHFKSESSKLSKYSLPDVVTLSELRLDCEKLGPPFGKLAKIPEITLLEGEKKFITKQDLEVHKKDLIKLVSDTEKGLYPNVTRITLSVISFLSMILAIMGIVLKSFQLSSYPTFNETKFWWILFGLLIGFGLASGFYIVVGATDKLLKYLGRLLPKKETPNLTQGTGKV